MSEPIPLTKYIEKNEDGYTLIPFPECGAGNDCNFEITLSDEITNMFDLSTEEGNIELSIFLRGAIEDLINKNSSSGDASE